MRKPTLRKKHAHLYNYGEIVYRSDGSLTLQATVPDTLTTWKASAFAVSDKTGLGIANPAQVSRCYDFLCTKLVINCSF